MKTEKQKSDDADIDSIEIKLERVPVENLAEITETLVHRLLNPLGFVGFKMGRLRGGRKEHIWIDP